MSDRYEPSQFEAKWRQRWKEAEIFTTRTEEGRPKFYGMDFFPYPSGAGLSVGHCRNYVPTDVICRMKVMQGFNVLHPMGFDAFGLPAENEAIKRKSHPAPMIERYAANYRRQMDLIGVSYDWSREFKSSDPSYYKWTQWIFERLFERGLAYRSMAAVNWDPIDKTVLADEEIVGGRAERSGALVEKKWIPQWFFKITDYAQRLIDDLDELNWPEGIKAQQRNWIGRSEGVQFSMTVSIPIHVPDVPTAPDPHIDLRSELEKLQDEIRASGFEPSAKESTIQKVGQIEQDLQKAAGAASGKKFDQAVDAAHKAMGKMSSNLEDFELKSRPNDFQFEVFTTRIDTIFGMTFCVLAPEHPLIDQIAPLVAPEHEQNIRAYQLQAKLLSDTDRQAENREKTGVFTGANAVNPANGKSVPIWIADYVLATYGTGAIMAVPGHDERDYAFATKFGISVIEVITPGGAPTGELPFVSKDGVLVNSGEYSGKGVSEAQKELGDWIERRGIGKRKIQYKLRDWLISRQRYWGCPIPIIHAKDGEMQMVPTDCLPVELPQVENYEPSGDGTSPLAHIPNFVNTTDLDGRLGLRETDTMGGFACSSWYFLRFCDPHNFEKAWEKNLVDYWMPVDCYVGGAEHAVMHLLYARFWTKVLYDAGLVSVKEPFSRLENQGQVLGMTPYRKPTEAENLDVTEEGILISYEEAETLSAEEVSWRWARMSKSKGNVVTPDEAVEHFGADALRLYLLFVAPFNADVNWSNDGMSSQSRFLSRLFKIVSDVKSVYEPRWHDFIGFGEADDKSRKIRRWTHQTIKKCTDDIDRFSFNTYVSTLMIFSNNLSDMTRDLTEPSRPVQLALSEAIDVLIRLLSPGAPHSADELWESIGASGFVFNAEWPVASADLVAEDEVTIAVQVNGKLRDTFTVSIGAKEEDVKALALASEKVQPHLEGKTIRKVIVIPAKLVNIVAN